MVFDPVEPVSHQACLCKLVEARVRGADDVTRVPRGRSIASIEGCTERRVDRDRYVDWVVTVVAVVEPSDLGLSLSFRNRRRFIFGLTER